MPKTLCPIVTELHLLSSALRIISSKSFLNQSLFPLRYIQNNNHNNIVFCYPWFRNLDSRSRSWTDDHWFVRPALLPSWAIRLKFKSLENKASDEIWTRYLQFGRLTPGLIGLHLQKLQMPMVGFELTAYRLQGDCSSLTELQRQNSWCQWQDFNLWPTAYEAVALTN